MYAGDQNSPSVFKNMSLKRDKQAFRMSTTAFTNAQTLSRARENIQSAVDQNNQQTVRPREEYSRRSERKSNSKVKRYRTDVPKLQQTPIFKKLTKLINEQKQYSRDSSKLHNHRTHCYTSFGSLNQQENIRYHITAQQNFPPKVVKDIYEKELARSEDGNVNYHFGNLEKSGYLYFSIERVLVLISSLCFIEAQQSEQPIIMELPQHTLSISEIIVSDFQIEDLERHPFGQRQIILLFWFQWQVGFYALQPRGLVKIVDLNMKFQTSCQAGIHFDYCKKGNIYYMNEAGEIGKIGLFNKSMFNILNWGRKFTIREYFYRFPHSTKRKREKFIDSGIFSKAKELFLDVKYYFSEKKTKGISIICDRERDLLYTLVETSIKDAHLNRLLNQSHREIRMYGISEQENLNFFEEIQNQMYSNPPRLLKQITQQKLYVQIGAHLFNNLPLPKFQVSAIYVPHYFDVGLEYYAHNKTNLIVILSNGSRLYLYVSQNKLILNEMINLPNLEELIGLEMKKDKFQSMTIAQKQPAGFKLIKHKLNLQDKSLALIGLYRRSVIALLFSQVQGQQDSNQEEVELLWDESLEYDSRGSPSNSIFVNFSDFHIYLGPEFETNIYKKKLSQYKYNQYQIINEDGNSINQSRIKYKKKKEDKIKINTIKQTPESRQILHYPQQYLFVAKQKIKGVTKLRPIDILLGTLQTQMCNYNESNINSLIYSEFELNALYKKIQNALKFSQPKTQKLQILIMMVQIFCDVDGLYYYQQNFNHLTRYRQSSSNLLGNQDRCSVNTRSESINSFQRRTSSTVMINNNFRDKQTEKLKEQQKRRRFTQKFSKINSFRKYRYCDLSLSALSSPSMEGYVNTKGQWDRSILKLVLKLITLLSKQRSQQKIREFYNEISKENEWISSTTKAPISHLNISQIQQAVLAYLSRLIVPLWSLKIRSISSFIYQYIVDVCSKILQMLTHLEEELMMSSISHNFSEMHNLCSIMVQYNSMLNAISNPPSLQYGEGLGSNKEIFEEALFYSLQKKKDISNVVNSWRQIFPNYFTLNLFKAIKLQAEISTISNFQDRKDAIINNHKQMPSYLLYQYYRDGTLAKAQIQTLLEMSNGDSNQTNIKNVNHLIITDSMDPYEKVQYAIKEISKNNRNLEEKQFLITYAIQNAANIRNLPVEQIAKKKKELERLQKVIKIQFLMYKQILKYEKSHPDTPQNPNAKALVQFFLLTPLQIKGLLKQLKNPMMQLIYYCNFWDPDINVEKNLKNLMFDSKDKHIKSSQMREKLAQIFEISSQKAGSNKLPLKLLLGVLDELAHNQIEQNDLTWVIKQNNEKLLIEKCWVPQFLTIWNYSKQMILDYYIEASKKHYKPYEPLSGQKSFMYYWLSAYTLVKFSYVQGRRFFQVANENILQLNRNAEYGQHVQQNSKLVINFIRQNLAL